MQIKNDFSSSFYQIMCYSLYQASLYAKLLFFWPTAHLLAGKIYYMDK